MAKLVVFVGVDERHPLVSTPAVIGRGGGSSIVIRDRCTSREHCEIYEENGTLLVRDLQSTNGTYINGRRIDEATLVVGDKLQVGNSVLEVTEIELPPQGEQTELFDGGLPQPTTETTEQIEPTD